jgi:kanamycin kinase/aminoglycoside 3'-phosphotransferase-2
MEQIVLSAIDENLPQALVNLLRHIQHAALVTLSASGARVYRLQEADGATRFLKIAEREVGQELVAEAARTRWLAGKLPVPRVLFHETDGVRSYLLTSGLPGTDAATLVDRPGVDVAHVARLLARGLRRVHAVPIDDCPFDHTLAQSLERARQRVARNLVDENDFDAERQGQQAAALLQELQANRPVDEERIFTHGDYCLPNILLDGDRLLDSDRVSGFIDLGRAGVGDRYRDLALCRRSLIRNCGPDAVPIFFDAYGLAPLNEEKLTYYQMLDELF